VVKKTAVRKDLSRKRRLRLGYLAYFFINRSPLAPGAKDSHKTAKNHHPTQFEAVIESK
jgi:hypothetical protein